MANSRIFKSQILSLFVENVAGQDATETGNELLQPKFEFKGLEICLVIIRISAYG